jgi:hypothetical protein
MFFENLQNLQDINVGWDNADVQQEHADSELDKADA